MMTDLPLVQQASRDAATALAQIGSHERECDRRAGDVDRRFAEIRDLIDDVKGSVDGVRKVMESRRMVLWVIAGNCLVAAVTSVFQIAKPLFHP